MKDFITLKFVVTENFSQPTCPDIPCARAPAPEWGGIGGGGARRFGTPTPLGLDDLWCLLWELDAKNMTLSGLPEMELFPTEGAGGSTCLMTCGGRESSSVGLSYPSEVLSWFQCAYNIMCATKEFKYTDIISHSQGHTQKQHEKALMRAQEFIVI